MGLVVLDADQIQSRPDAMKLSPRLAFLKDWFGVLPAGALALLPFLVWHRQFAELFWFGDEWDLLDQIDRVGLWHWTWVVFAENFVPVFKLLWGGVAIADGGYFTLLVLLWLTHVANTVLLGRMLRRAGFGWFSTLFSQLVFALASANIETLGWTVQWSAVLATTFLLLALDSFPAEPATGLDRRRLIRLVVFSAGSALSFSRGVLTGAVLALDCFWPVAVDKGVAAWRSRGLAATLVLLPAVITASLIVLFANGNHQHLGGHLGSAGLYGLWYFCLNPLYLLLEVDSWGPRTVLLGGLAKVALLAWGLRRASDRSRRLLVLLLAFDLGNAVLLGIGRYHTGLETVISSRYQYNALLAVLPFLGFWLEDLGRRIPARLRTLLAALFLVFASFHVARHWSDHLAVFAEQRGTAARRLLFTDPNPSAQGAVPGVPSMSTARAKELIRRYDLH
jgi:hypothetical protein